MTVAGFGLAQNEEKQEYRIKTVKVINGEKMVIDTSFNSKEALHSYMESTGLNIPHVLPDEDVDVDIEAGDPGKNKKITKVIKYEMRIEDTIETDDDITLEKMEGLNSEHRKELLKKINELEDAEIDMEDAEAIHEYLNLGEGADVKVMVIHRIIEVEDVSETERKQAKLHKDVMDDPGLMISPNPAQDELIIELKNAITEDAQATPTVTLLDMSGKVVKTIQPESIDNQITVPVNDISKGSYILRYTNGEQSAVKKVIIQ